MTRGRETNEKMPARYVYGLRSNGKGGFYVMEFAVRDGRKLMGGRVVSRGALPKADAELILAGLLADPLSIRAADWYVPDLEVPHAE